MGTDPRRLRMSCTAPSLNSALKERRSRFSKWLALADPFAFPIEHLLPEYQAY